MSQTLRCVCGRCNNEWMSRLQTRVKPALVKLMTGDWTLLSAAELASIGAWAAMTTMVIEQAHLPSAIIPQSQRTHLMETGTMPEGWLVGVAKYAGVRLQGTFFHRALALLPKEGTSAITEKDHSQTSLFGLGRALFHTFSTSSEARLRFLIPDMQAYGDAYGLRILLPEYHAGSATFEGPLLDGGELQAIVDHFGSVANISGPLEGVLGHTL